jgi:lipopolysaccharide export system protein LptA
MLTLIVDRGAAKECEMFRLAALVSVALLFGAPIATAQISALRNHDTRAPFDLSADRFEVRDKEGISLFTGNVIAIQGDLKLISDRARAFYARTAKSLMVRRVDAQGSVKFTSPSESVSAAWGIYDLDGQVLTLGGDVTLTRGQDVIKGQRLELNLRTGITTLDGRDGGATPRNIDPAKTRGSDGRVRARFTVPER